MIKIKHNSVDTIEDYITRCESVPLISEINRNGKLIITEFDFSVSENYSTSLVIGDEIDVYLNTTTNHPFFTGSISEVNFNYKNKTNEVVVKSCLHKLQDISLSYDNLHANLEGWATTSTQYIASDNFSLPNAQVLWTIEVMFRLAGFLNTTWDSEIAVKEIQTIAYEGNDYTMRIAHLKFDENVLYALNQAVAVNHTVIDTESELASNKITFFDFISVFCSYIGARIGLTNIGFAKELSIGLIGQVNIPIIDDETYSKRERYVRGKGGGYSHNVVYNSARHHYRDTTQQPLNNNVSFVVGEGKNRVPTMSNWIYMYQKIPQMGGSGGDVLGHVYPTLSWNADDYLGGRNLVGTKGNYNHIDKEITDYKITEISQTINSNLQQFPNSKSTRANPKNHWVESVFEVKQ